VGGQFEFESLEQELQLALGPGVAGQYQFAAVGGHDMHIDP